MKLKLNEEVWVKGKVHCVNNIENVAIVEIIDFRTNGSEHKSFTAVFPFEQLRQVDND